MSLNHNNQKFDIRILKRSLREGKTTQKEVDDYLKKLPDESAKAQEISLFEEEIKETLTFTAAKSI